MPAKNTIQCNFIAKCQCNCTRNVLWRQSPIHANPTARNKMKTEGNKLSERRNKSKQKSTNTGKKGVGVNRNQDTELEGLVQLKLVSMPSEKPICAPPRLSEVSPTLPLKPLIRDGPLSSFQGRSSSASSLDSFHVLFVVPS